MEESREVSSRNVSILIGEDLLERAQSLLELLAVDAAALEDVRGGADAGVADLVLDERALSTRRRREEFGDGLVGSQHTLATLLLFARL